MNLIKTLLLSLALFNPRNELEEKGIIFNREENKPYLVKEWVGPLYDQLGYFSDALFAKYDKNFDGYSEYHAFYKITKDSSGIIDTCSNAFFLKLDPYEKDKPSIFWVDFDGDGVLEEKYILETKDENKSFI